MSYILDALRKAVAQRERDPVRGIHAQPLRNSADRRSGKVSAWWMWGGAAAGLVALASLGWYLLREPEVVVVAEGTGIIDYQ